MTLIRVYCTMLEGKLVYAATQFAASPDLARALKGGKTPISGAMPKLVGDPAPINFGLCTVRPLSGGPRGRTLPRDFATPGDVTIPEHGSPALDLGRQGDRCPRAGPIHIALLETGRSIDVAGLLGPQSAGEALL